ncbi:MAG: hypothetical protein MHMPM18_002450 [Marteilia pararefringens]
MIKFAKCTPSSSPSSPPFNHLWAVLSRRFAAATFTQCASAAASSSPQFLRHEVILKTRHPMLNMRSYASC